LLRRFANPQSTRRAAANGRAHYDRGNSLYEAMLGPTMVYSCAYWRSAQTLEEAQRAKLELICRKIQLRPGLRVLDIGCGWGAFACHAAQQGASVVGITVSPAQADHARARCRGLPVEIRLEDYRSLAGRFDRVVSIGMFEHVGPQNYRTYMSVVRRCLAEDGIFLLHTIGGRLGAHHGERWLDRYIFPGAVLPSAQQIAGAAEGLLVLEDWHNFGAYYDRTLLTWWQNFERAWPSLRKHYDDRFYRMWRYYLLSCAGTFRARWNQLWQLVFSREGLPGGYRRIHA
jgi:cyclopropane-fatty-acyl-phospholipid synthase